MGQGVIPDSPKHNLPIHDQGQQGHRGVHKLGLWDFKKANNFSRVQTGQFCYEHIQPKQQS